MPGLAWGLEETSLHLSIIHPTVMCGWMWTPQDEGLRQGTGNEEREGDFSTSSPSHPHPSSGWPWNPAASLHVDFICCCCFWPYHSGARPALAAMGSQGCQACQGPLGRMGMMDSRGPRVSQVSLLAWVKADPGAGRAKPSLSAGPQSPDFSLQADSSGLAACCPHLLCPVERSKGEPLSLQTGNSLFTLQVDT